MFSSKSSEQLKPNGKEAGRRKSAQFFSRGSPQPPPKQPLTVDGTQASQKMKKLNKQARPVSVNPPPPPALPARSDHTRPFAGNDYPPPQQYLPMQPHPSTQHPQPRPQWLPQDPAIYQEPPPVIAFNPASPIAAPNPPFSMTSDSRRVSSAPSSPKMNGDKGSNTKRATIRKSWMPGTSRKSSLATQEPAPTTWVAGHETKVAYDVSRLVNALPVTELWDDDADTLVYLFPKTSGRGPSFRVWSPLFSSSPILTQLAYGSIYSKSPRVEVGRRADLSGSLATPPMTPNLSALDNSSTSSSRTARRDDFGEDIPQEIHLYLPISLSADSAFPPSGVMPRPPAEDDVDKLVGIRNLFAFVLGQSLLCTEKRPSIFGLFMQVSEYLQSYNFTNIDGSTFGETAASSFDQYVEELGLADVRGSREKTIEALVLGERMRSVTLYNEAFVHAVGKYEDIQYVSKMNGPSLKFGLISPATKNRMERASIDLQQREMTVNLRLWDFDFPSVFAGIMSSKTADERKVVDFAAWKDSFNATRKHVLSYYKQKYGSWPPKAKSKKNDLETSGLNRLVVKQLYEDFAQFYDLYVDRTSLTTRVYEVASPTSQIDPSDPATVVIKVLRKVFDEYDRANVPVQPPIPFDTPLLPELGSLQKSGKLLKTEYKSRSKKLKDDDLSVLLRSSVNTDIMATLSPSQNHSAFLAALLDFEGKQARGSSTAELANLRAGMWMFMYAVIQALPMLVVDAPSVQFTQGCEYFLCEPPRGGVPWVNASAATGIIESGGTVPGAGSGRSWYGVGGSGGAIVSLPSDLVEHGVDGIYKRSHCWVMAKKWNEQHDRLPSIDETRASYENNPRTGAMHSHVPSNNTPAPMLKPLPFEVGRQSRPSTAGSQGAASQGAASSRHSSRSREVMLSAGLQQLPLPEGLALPSAQHIPSRSSRELRRGRGVSQSAMPPLPIREAHTPGAATFDDILAGVADKGKGKKDKGKRNITK